MHKQNQNSINREAFALFFFSCFVFLFFSPKEKQNKIGLSLHINTTGVMVLWYYDECANSPNALVILSVIAPIAASIPLSP